MTEPKSGLEQDLISSLQERLEAAQARIKELENSLAVESKCTNHYRLETDIARAKIQSLEKDCECERMRLAACGTAALGYFNGCHEDYKSASLGDVLRLLDKNKSLESKLALVKESLKKISESCNLGTTQCCQWPHEVAGDMLYALSEQEEPNGN